MKHKGATLNSVCRIALAASVVAMCYAIFTPFNAVASEKTLRNVDAHGSDSPGRLLGMVTDSTGIPLGSTLISVTGPEGVSLAVCDTDGWFELRELPPGNYLLRAHLSGFMATQRHEVEVESGLSLVRAITLKRDEASPRKLLAAGFGESVTFQEPSFISGLETLDGTKDGSLPASDSQTVNTTRVVPHDDSEKAWRMRRARRSVLKDRGLGAALGGSAEDSFRIGFDSPLAASLGEMPELAGGFPISGQFQLLMRAQIYSSDDLWSTDVLPGQIAYVSLGGPKNSSPWGLRGAVRTGDAGSWALEGTYLSETKNNELAFGFSYSRQNLDIGSTTETLVPEVLFKAPATQEGSREVGSLSVRGQWDITQRVSVDYGATVARYEYLEEDGLLSPNATVTLEPVGRTRVRFAVAQNRLAPGAEEFLPPSEGVWLPPERRFALLSPEDSLSAERSRHLELALERDVGASSTIGVRRFYQDVDDQLVALFFNARPEFTVMSSDHYYLTKVNDVNSKGWGLMFSHTLMGRVRGSFDYTLTNAQWAPLSAGRLLPVGLGRTGAERFHDVTTSLETEIPETATEVFVLYRLNSAFSLADQKTKSMAVGLDGRFALRVKQGLPFSPIEGSDWQVLVDVRSLFREQVSGSSVYDELLVTSPPKQVVGGLVVLF